MPISEMNFRTIDGANNNSSNPSLTATNTDFNEF
jgi:hypothetical protein